MDHTYQVAVNTVDNPEPSTPLQPKFSGQYCTAASASVRPPAGVTFTPEATSDPRVRRLMDKITLVCDPELEASYQADRNRWALPVGGDSEGRPGAHPSGGVPYGDFNNPLPGPMSCEVSHPLADGVLGPDRVAALVERSLHLEELDDVNRLFEGLCPASAGSRRNWRRPYLTNGALRYESERSTCQIRHSRRGYPRP